MCGYLEFIVQRVQRTGKFELVVNEYLLRANLEVLTFLQRVGTYGKVSTCFKKFFSNCSLSNCQRSFIPISVYHPGLYSSYVVWRLMSGFMEARTCQSLLHISVLAHDILSENPSCTKARLLQLVP